MAYNKYSSALIKKYGEKVYKIPINLPVTCPNRDGTIGTGGCVFCGDVAAGFEAREASMSVKAQLAKNIEVIRPKYKANRFIAYFQNYTNTYMKLQQFKSVIMESIVDDVVGISISTRPDCVAEPYLEFLSEIKRDFGLEIEIELGLQSININTLEKINRGHGLAAYIDAVLRIKKHQFTICTHLIGNLPWDTEFDFYEAAKLMNVLEIEGVKIHSLYILKNTILGKWYLEDNFEMISSDEYIDRVIHFLRLLNPEIVIQRLFGRSPEEDSLFCNWESSWRKLHNQLEAKMEENAYHQGDLYIK
ncbi:MAG TPA: TIGR01212 family radical SAM protein [Clostridiales bacterium UBA8960]|nr:TIGR01212 family radical SAM protein [Clostridiales bacterium UBA8960]